MKKINYGWNYAGAPTGVGTNLIGTEADTTSNVIGGLQYAGFGGVKTLNYGANPRKLSVYYDLKRQQMTGLVEKDSCNPRLQSTG